MAGAISWAPRRSVTAMGTTSRARFRSAFRSLRLTTDGLKEHIVNFSVPGRNDYDLSVIADLLISGE